MSIGDEKPAGAGLAWLPVTWVAVVMLLGVYGIVTAFPLLYEYGLPDSVFPLIYAGMAAGVVTLLWGLYLLGLAYSRSFRFPRHFIVWQVAQIAWLLARETYVLVVPEFVFTPLSLAIPAVEIAIGVFCIWIVTRASLRTTAYSNAEAGRPPVVLSVILGFLGLAAGGAIGAVAGFLAGGAIAEIADISCFEGACGYFAAAIGLGGLLVGAIGGCVTAVLVANRRRPAGA